MAGYTTELRGMQPHKAMGAKPALHNHRDVEEAVSSAIKDALPKKKATKGNGDICSSGPWIKTIMYRTSGGEAICEHEGKCYKQSFSVDRDGEVNLIGDKVEVQQRTEYEEV